VADDGLGRVTSSNISLVLANKALVW
jgi:hypothetical protein